MEEEKTVKAVEEQEENECTPVPAEGEERECIGEENQKQEDILLLLSEIKEELNAQREQSEKRDALIDKLYADKKKYENDIVASLTNPIVLDVIQVIEEINAQIEKVPMEYTEENYRSLFKRFSAVSLRLEDLLYGHDVEPYILEGEIPDSKQQKTIRAIETSKEELSGTIAEHLTAGWKKGDRIIKPERITVYRYTEKNKKESVGETENPEQKEE